MTQISHKSAPHISLPKVFFKNIAREINDNKKNTKEICENAFKKVQKFCRYRYDTLGSNIKSNRKEILKSELGSKGINAEEIITLPGESGVGTFLYIEKKASAAIGLREDFFVLYRDNIPIPKGSISSCSCYRYLYAYQSEGVTYFALADENYQVREIDSQNGEKKVPFPQPENYRRNILAKVGIVPR